MELEQNASMLDGTLLHRACARVEQILQDFALLEKLACAIQVLFLVCAV